MNNDSFFCLFAKSLLKEDFLWHHFVAIILVRLPRPVCYINDIILTQIQNSNLIKMHLGYPLFG